MWRQIGTALDAMSVGIEVPHGPGWTPDGSMPSGSIPPIRRSLAAFPSPGQLTAGRRCCSEVLHPCELDRMTQDGCPVPQIDRRRWTAVRDRLCRMVDQCVDIEQRCGCGPRSRTRPCPGWSCARRSSWSTYGASGRGQLRLGPALQSEHRLDQFSPQRSTRRACRRVETVTALADDISTHQAAGDVVGTRPA